MPEKPSEPRSERQISRRQLVGGAADLGGAAALGGGLGSQFLPDSLNHAVAEAATDPQRFDVSQIKHMVVIMWTVGGRVCARTRSTTRPSCSSSAR